MDTIKINSLRNIEFIQLGDATLGIVNRNNPLVLMLQEQYDNYFSANSIVSNLYTKGNANPITQSIVEADARRDATINGINYVLLGYTYHFTDSVRNAANLLYNNISSYGSGIAKLNYQSETATLKSILADWTDKPELAQAVITLQLDDWKKEMETANNAFDSLYLDRTQDISTTGDVTFKAARLAATTAYYELRDTIDAYYTIKKDEEKKQYAKVINELNALIKQYNSMLNNRGGTNTPPPNPPAEPAVK